MVGPSGQERLIMYKRCGAGTSGAEARRKRCAAQRKEERDKRRTDAFVAHRGICTDEPSVAVSRVEKFKEWKKQKREMSSKKETQKKPPFVMGKITYNDSHLYKSLESTTFQVPKGVVPVQPTPATRRLRSHSKNSQKVKLLSVKEAIADFTSAMALTSKNSKGKNCEIKSKDSDSELLNRTFDASQSPPQPKVLPSINEKPLRKYESEELDRNPFCEINKLPTVVRTEGIFSINEGSMQQTAEERSAEHFRSLYNQAVVELNRLCEEWTLQLENELPDSIKDEINVAIGYAKLLISQKLKQFGDLISEHENMNCSTELKVLSNDLDGFWNMVNNQVEDVFRKFKKLETLKHNDWQESIEKSIPAKQATQNIVQKSKISKAKGTSGLRTFLAQARSHARMNKDENRNPALDMFNVQNIGKSRPMSPVVMRVTSRAKFLGSPKTPHSDDYSVPHNIKPAHGENIPSSCLAQVRTPLNVIQTTNSMSIIENPKSAKKTPARKLKLKDTPGSTPMRRSQRILQLKKTPS